jgi:hypothetical protein
MSKIDVEIDFPALTGKDYELSDEDFNYNCLAYAVVDISNWWEPPQQAGRYWPPGFPEDTTVRTVELIMAVFGFTVEVNPLSIPETEAIAIYAEGNDWTHFARFSNGSWSSKLGEGHDVKMIELKDLEGHIYGNVTKVLSRPKRVEQ